LGADFSGQGNGTPIRNPASIPLNIYDQGIELRLTDEFEGGFSQAFLSYAIEGKIERKWLFSTIEVIEVLKK
jgi:hypothetical protein